MPRTFSRFSNVKDKKIRILIERTEKDSEGFARTVYYDLIGAALWAHYRSVSGTEFHASRATGYKEEAIFTVNWHGEITAGMFVLHKEKAYKIIYVDDLEGYKKDLQLRCEASTAVTSGDIL